jgi:flagellar biosynthesis protein FliP
MNRRGPKNRMKYAAAFLVIAGLLFLIAPSAWSEPLPIPTINLNIGGSGESGQVSTVLKLLLLLTILALAPSILIMLTSFTRIVIVFSLLRHALGTQQLPPNQVIIGLSLFLTFFIMTPVWEKVNTQALQPYFNNQISGEKAFELSSQPIRDFMMKQTREKDLALFVKMSKSKRPESPADISLSVLIPSFVISELRTAFQIGFLIYMPFLVLDMVVASVLLSMGMLMLPPIMVSLPFKLLLFVLVDGWYLIVGSLVQSFGPS